jgi:diguanylate cyclase (GGDEF)-like protein/PAS domain S-box-containing protein
MHPLLRIAFLPVVILAVTGVGGGYYWTELREEQRQELQQTRARIQLRSEQLSTAMAQHVDTSLDGVEHTLQYLAMVFLHDRAQFDSVARTAFARHAEEMWSSVSVFDGHGQRVYAYGTAPAASLLALNPRPALEMGDTIWANAPQPPLIPLSYGMRLADGRSISVVLTLRADYFLHRFSELNTSGLDRLAVVGPTGHIVFSNSRRNDFRNATLPQDRPYLHAKPGASGWFRDRSVVDQVPLLFYWRTLQNWPVSVVVAVNEDDEMAQVQGRLAQEQGRSVAGLLLLGVFSLALAVLLLRLGLRNRQLSESDARFRTLFEKNGSVMLLIEPLSGEILEANAAARAFYGYAQLVGMPIAAINTLKPEEAEQERMLALREDRNYFLFTHRLASGALREVEVYSTPLLVGGRAQLYSVINDITQRRQAERQLVSLLEAQKAILQSEVVGIVMVRARTMTWMNTAYAKMLGFQAEQLMHRSTRMLYPDDAAFQRFEAEAYPLLAQGQVYRGQRQFLRGDATWGWYDISGAQLSGGGAESVWAFVDITANHALEMERRRLAQAVEQSPVSIVVTNLQGNIEYVNEAFCQTAGYSRDEVLGHNPRMLQAKGSDREQFSGMWQTLLAGKAWQGIFSNERKDGSCYWESAQISPVLDEQGAITHFLAVKENITERKRAEERLTQARQHLQESHDLLDQLSRYVPGVIYQYLMYPDGRSCYPYASDGACDIWGVSPAQVQEDAAPMFAAIHPDDVQRLEASLHASGRSLQPWHEEYRVQLPEQGVRWLAGHAMPALQPDGAVLWHGITNDVTEQKSTEASLQLAANVFSHAREGIIIADAQGLIVDVNDTFSHITGYARADVIGKNPNLLRSGKHAPAYYAAMWKSLQADDYWSGEIINRRRDNSTYVQNLTISAVRNAEGRVQNYVALFNDITLMKEHQHQLERIAHFDALTGLPNRLLLADRLEQAILQCQRQTKALAVVYLDLDGFKAVNDAHGHDVGDGLLVALAQRLKAVLREGDTLARMGGDEFVAVLTQLESPHDCEPVIARLLQSAAEPVCLGELVLHVSASIGVTHYPVDGVDADLLLRHADQAMYLAKHGGKNRFHTFDVDQDAAVQSHRESLERIRQALQAQEFVLYYQPKVNMVSGQVVGAEALIRWQHPERGLLQPADFLPTIENHALSIELGDWVLESALAQMARWHAMGFEISVSVNVGARQLQNGDFVQSLAALLDRYPDVPSRHLELEVLETSALEDVVQVSKIMQACHMLGVTFALDDFGTGYSSLIYLKRLPAGMLKIDQNFVRDMLDDPSDCAIVEAVIGLAAVFKRNVIAEGVETIAHGSLLLSMGCHLVQGYGIARPMPAKDFPDWAAHWQSPAVWRDPNAVALVHNLRKAH